MMISLGTNFYPGVYDTYNTGMRDLFLGTAVVVFFRLSLNKKERNYY